METAFDGIAGAMEEVMKEIREKLREASKHAGIWESLQAFVSAVDWKVIGVADHQVIAAALITVALQTHCEYIICHALMPSMSFMVYFLNPARRGDRHGMHSWCRNPG